MIDLEDLLRAELRARAAAAETAAEAAAANQPAVLAGALDRRIRRSRLRRRWTASALSAAAVAAAVILPLALLSPGAGNVSLPAPRSAVPLTDTAATPPGWVPYAHGAAQLSVPLGWRAATRPVCDRRLPGYLVLGNASTSLTVRNPHCLQAPNMAAILPIQSAQGQPAGPPTRINGIPVTRVQTAAPPGSVSYAVPALHVVITARGPLARRVLATLTRSPVSVVLAPGPRFAVPAGWAWHQAGGIQFAAPARWSLVRNGSWPCGMTSDSVLIIPARNRQMPVCAGGDLGPAIVAGVIVAVGRSVVVPTSGYLGCRRLDTLRACYWAAAYPDLVLDVAVFAPGRQRGTLVEIGLAGSGAVARTIFDSIQPR